MAGKGFKLADSYVAVHGDGTDVPNEVASDIEKGQPRVKSSAVTLAKGFVGGMIAYEGFKRIGSFIAESISGASDLNETVSASQAIFGKQAGAMEKWAGTAATSFGLSKQAALEYATSFGDMFLQIGFTGEQAKKSSQDVVQMAADLGSFKNLETGDVLERISAAMRGEYDSLQAVIPNISAARVEHEAMAMGLVQTTVDTEKLAQANTAADLAQQRYTEAVEKHGEGSREAQTAGLALAKANDAVEKAAAGSTGEISAQAKAQAVLSIINKDGSRAMGDFSKTSSSVANQQKILAAQTEDLKASIGVALLPVVQKILGVFNDNFLPVIKSVAEWIGKNSNIVMPLVVVLGALAAVVWVVNAAMYASPITWIILGIGLLIAAIVLLVTNWNLVVVWITAYWQQFINWITGVINGFVSWWNGVWGAVGAWIVNVWNGFIGWIVGVWNGFIGWIRAVINAYVSFWVSVWTNVKNFVSGIWSGIVSWITGVWNGFLAWIRGAINGYVSFWVGAWNNVKNFVSGIWSGIVSTATGAWNGLVGFMRGIPGAIKAVFDGAVSWLGDIGKNIVSGLWNGIKAAWDGFMSWWNSVIGGIADVAKNLLGIHSPSTVFRFEVGQQVVKGAELGVKDRKAALRRAVQDTFAITGDVDTAGGMGFGATGDKAKGDGATYYMHIEHLELSASDFEDMQRALDTLKGLAQTARQGKGTTATATAVGVGA